MKIWISMLTLLLGLTASGCFVDLDRPGHYHDDAILTVEWSIDGRTDPRECRASGADYAYVRVESGDGVVDEQEVPCEDFGTDFWLPPGRYWVVIVLLDRRHNDRTETVETDRRYLDDGDFIEVDFPADSFL